MGKRLAGVAYIKADGVQFEVNGGVECPLSDVKRETVMSVAGPSGYKETALAPYVKLTANFTPDFPVDKLRTSTSMTVTCELANGKVYVLSEAWLVEEPAAKNDDGTADLHFEGMNGGWQ